MSLERELHKRGGLALTTELAKLGYSQHALRTAVASNRISRVKKGWVALPQADPLRIFAARHNVVVSCITQAKRLGLWVLEHKQIHVAGSLTSRRSTAPDSVVHWRTPLVLRRPDILEDCIENVLDCVSVCQPHDAALAIWDSALQKKLIDYPALASLKLGPAARTLLAECTPFSDSGLETLFRTNLRWTKVPIRAQAWLHGHRVDFLIGDRLVVQLDGKQHAGAQRVIDMQHDAELIQRGYTVLRFGYEQVVHRWAEVEAAILRVIARNLHLAAH